MSRYPSYNYGSVAYKTDPWVDDYGAGAPSVVGVAPARKYSPKRRVDVVPGGAQGRAASTSPAHSFAVKVGKAIVAAALVFACIGIWRVTLSAATVAEALEARQLSNELDEARSTISQLEVTQSSLSNPVRIKTEAALLGMSNPETTAVIDLTQDVVATDAEGNLSLVGSLDAMAASSEPSPDSAQVSDIHTANPLDAPDDAE